MIFNSQQPQKIRFLYLLLLFIPLLLNGQNFADKSYYLVDSLNYKDLPVLDKKMIDSSLVAFHNTTFEEVKLKTIYSLVENSWNDDVWITYNKWLYEYTKKKVGHLDFKNDINKKDKILLKYYANATNNIGVFLQQNV